MNEYVAVQRSQDGLWGAPRPWFAVDGIGISLAIRPGDTLKPLAMDFGYVGRTPGRYRFIFEVAFDSLGRNRVTEAERVSPPFQLEP
jgi:hypothetical protein